MNIHVLAPTIVLGYLGPQTVLPVASAVAAVIGFVLIFWRFLTGLVRKFFKFLFRRHDRDTD